MKKTLTFFITLIITITISSFVCYASEYDNYIEETNNKYGLNLEKNKNAENDIDFANFKKRC